MKKQFIKKGDKYNKLTAIRFDHQNKHGKSYWLFKCDCGNTKVIIASNVKCGNTKSCGCLSPNHGIAYNKIYPSEYKIWSSMKQRCSNENNKYYKDYGGRGITVCKSWMKFKNFYKDMGKRPKNKSLDRIDNNGNYEPKNCRWATGKEQNNNRRDNHFLFFNNKSQTIAQWADELCIKSSVLYARLLRLKWPTVKALTTPVNNWSSNKKEEYKNKFKV